jgi:hypothetical protein
MIVIFLVICDLTTNTNNNEYALDSSKFASIIKNYFKIKEKIE